MEGRGKSIVAVTTKWLDGYGPSVHRSAMIDVGYSSFHMDDLIAQSWMSLGVDEFNSSILDELRRLAVDEPRNLAMDELRSSMIYR